MGDTGDTRRKASEDAPAGSDASGRSTVEARSSARSWYRSNRSDLRFLLIFGGLMGVYYVLTTTSYAKETFFPWYLRVTAQVSGGALQTFGYDGLEVRDNAISAPGGSITVERGCDALAPMALYISAVLASPTSLVSMMPAVVGGVLILIVLNLIRIVTLFLTRIHWSGAFDVMHLDVWQAMFIFVAILLWALWASWTTRGRKRETRAPA